MSVSILTYLHIVLGEMIPKSLALQNAESTALVIVTPMQMIQKLLLPFVLILNGVGNLTLKLIGIGRSEHVDHLFHTSDELEFVINESEEGGLLLKVTSAVLRDLLDFGELKAREVMVPRVRIVGIPLGSDQKDL